MEIEELRRQAKEIAQKHGMEAEVPEGVSSVGVGGDHRTYTPIVILSSSTFPDHEALARASTEITNSLPVNRVTFEIARRK
ncbi:MAG: hypothetical protein KGZ30_03225 [Anaplasmataceae bacterium]|nr:hypothetical protein [Anaplasmataceae bacterium]